jgi:nucleotide-binding universal stress UspA family protein
MANEDFACPLTKGEKILVAVDGSEYSDKVLDQAISLGKTCNSSIFAISVIDLYPEQLAVAPALEEKMSKETREVLDRVKDRVEKENIPCETIVRIGGQAHEFIVEEAKKRDIDLIVIGSHGKTGLKSVLIGSVSQKVIGHSPCPVLVVPVLK